HVGPVSAAPPGVTAGSVVRSGALTPALSHTAWGETLKNATRVAFLFYLCVFLNAKNTKNTHTRTSIADTRKSSKVHIIKTKKPTNAINIYFTPGYIIAIK
ncbi:hypothetical protein, partial [Enterobacter intestinihominis]